MRFDDKRVDVGGVERRGRGGRLAVGGGAGVLGLIVYLIIGVLGGDASLLVPSNTDVGDTGESVQQLEARCNSEGALDQYNDCFLIKVYNEINEVWSETLQGYRQPRLGFFEQGVQTGCGPASSEVGPFYCPADQQIFIDLGFLQQLQQQFGAEGRYAQAYILAHESGHHLQTLRGALRNGSSIEIELQADCYAGVWGRLADDRGNVAITERELDEALNAAAAVGDDRIQQKTQGRIDPESWTHGSAQQRRDAYLRGFQSGDIGVC